MKKYKQVLATLLTMSLTVCAIPTGIVEISASAENQSDEISSMEEVETYSEENWSLKLLNLERVKAKEKSIPQEKLVSLAENKRVIQWKPIRQMITKLAFLVVQKIMDK